MAAALQVVRRLRAVGAPTGDCAAASVAPYLTGPTCACHNMMVRAAVDANAATQWIEGSLGRVTKQSFVAGSKWSSAYVYETDQGAKLFVKTALGRDEAMFRGEALGLQAMYDTQALRIPAVLHVGSLGAPAPGSNRHPGSFIVMEYLAMSGEPSQRELGRRLAMMHMATPKDPNAAAGKCGFPVDNTIGGTSQPNPWTDDWVTFLRDQRLLHQLKLAGDARLMAMGERLCANLGDFFEGAGPVRPCVLHGDLWSGNIGAVDGQPTIYDPATYYGHSEAEFGMSWCAGFSADFYAAYHELIPRAPGFDERAKIYLLYHYLNHYNLFGSSYYGACERLLKELTA